MTKAGKLFQKFFKTKTIQRSDKFITTIIEKPPIATSQRLANIRSQMDQRSGIMPQIQEYQVGNITLPHFDFQKESFKEGIFPKSFPVLNHEGFEVAIMFEEDNVATVSRFVNWCQLRIIDDKGIYFPDVLNKIGDISLEILDEFDVTIVNYLFKDVYFLRATPVTFDYSQATAQKWSITFGVDNVEFFSRGVSNIR